MSLSHRSPLLPALTGLVVALAAAGLAAPLTAAAAAVRIAPLSSLPPALSPDPAGGFEPGGPGAWSGYQWPLPGPPPVTRGFHPPAQPWLSGHRGVDLAGAAGVVVSAAGQGTVYFAGQVAGRGVVSLAHPGGLRTTYEPVDPLVSVGDPVVAGEAVGELRAGHPGCPVTACLHWGLRIGEAYLDPLSLLGSGQVRLLPRGEAGEVAAAG